MFEGRNVHYSADNKPLCSFSGKLCKLRRLSGFAFCVRHILEDPTAPYRRCGFVVKATSQQCSSAIPVSQNREYCHSHMQVMGIIPKKERRKKSEHEADGTAADKSHPSNSLYHLHDKPTKLFPELAGKLSAADSASTTNGFINGHELNGGGDDAKKPPTQSPSKMSASTLRRHKKAGRKALAVIRKKQLGLLSDADARSVFSPAACQAYQQHALRQTYHSDLLTSLVDSSDDELACDYYPPPTYSRMLRKHNLAGKRTARAGRPSVGPAAAPCATTALPDTDLTRRAADPPSQRITDRPEDGADDNGCDSDDPDLVSLMKNCADVIHSCRLNHDSASYHRSYLGSLLAILRQSPRMATRLVRAIQRPAGREQAEARPSKAAEGTGGANKLQGCQFGGTEAPCARPTLPFSNYCVDHISSDRKQKLFSGCSAAECGPGSDCQRAVVDIGQSEPLCSRHATPASHYEESSDASGDQAKKSKKKSKSLALLKPSRRRKKKPSRSDKLTDEPLTSDPAPSPRAAAVNGRSTPEVSSAPDTRDADLDAMDDSLSPLDKSLELPLDQAESKLLLEEFNIFSGDPEEELGLTEADAELILNGQSENSPILDESSELPDDITDAILHVESEQKALASQQNSMQPSHHSLPEQPPPPPTHGHMVNGPPLLPNGGYELNHSLSHSHSGYGLEGSMNSGLHASYNHHHHHHHQGPPPQYPGNAAAAKMMQHTTIGSMSHPSPHMPQHISYSMHGHHLSQQQQQQPAAGYPHQQLQHPKLQQHQSPVSQPSRHIMSGGHAPAGYHLPPGLPPSSTLLDPSRHAPPAPRMDRLPPVSTIAMQQQWQMDDSGGMYNNGYHNPGEPIIYSMSNGLPSPPPQYHTTRDHRPYQHMGQHYAPGPYGIIPPSPQPQHLNMPLQ